MYFLFISVREKRKKERLDRYFSSISLFPNSSKERERRGRISSEFHPPKLKNIRKFQGRRERRRGIKIRSRLSIRTGTSDRALVTTRLGGRKTPPPSESIDGRVKDSSLIDVGRAAEGGGWRLASVPFLVTSIPVTFRVSHVDQSQRCGKCNSLSNVRPADRQAGGRAGRGRQASRSLPSPPLSSTLCSEDVVACHGPTPG